MNKINFAFWGTPKIAVDTLEILEKGGFLPSLIITTPDQPKGRGLLVTAPPVKIWAKKNNIPYKQDFKNLPEFDVSVVVAYGKIIPANILETPKFGSINVHYSLLPKYRGASPVETAILNGETKTGVTIQKMEARLDAGPIIAQKEIAILPEETASELRQRLTQMGAELLIKILPDVISNKISPIPQDENNATYSKKIKKEDGKIELGVNEILNYNKFRAYAEWPRTFFFRNEKRIIITEAELRNGNFIIKKVLPENKKEITYEEFLKNG